MTIINETRFCPICEQIVPSEVNSVRVVVFPSRAINLHDGCARKVLLSYKEYLGKSGKKEGEIKLKKIKK